MESRAQLLSRAHSGDRDAVQQMIEENTGLIWSVARRYFGRGVDADDLYQLGCLGFLKAIEGFDERFGTQFSTYAVPKIAGEIRRFLRDDGTVKVSRSLKERAAFIKGAPSGADARQGAGAFRDRRGMWRERGRDRRGGDRGRSGGKSAARERRRRLHA